MVFGRSLRCIAMLAACASSASLAAEGSPAPSDPLAEVTKMIGARRYAEAKASLAEVLKNKPENWRAVTFEDDKVVRAYWDMGEFVRCGPLDGKEQGKSVVWKGVSYSKAHYLLAYVLQAEGDGRGAMQNLDAALAMEPDHPAILSQIGYSRIRSDTRDAIRHFEKAHQRPCVGNQWMAAAYRGHGVALAQARELDAAEAALRKSLVLEPGNKSAERELEYVAHLRGGGRSGVLSPVPDRQQLEAKSAASACGPVYPTAFPCLGGGKVEQVPQSPGVTARPSVISYEVAQASLVADLERQAAEAGWRLVGTVEGPQGAAQLIRRNFQKEGRTVQTIVGPNGNSSYLAVF